MRVRSGGPTKSGQASGAQKSTTSGAQGAKFAGMVDRAGGSTDQESKGKTAIMAELEKLAAEIQSGLATKEEASRRFVGLVIEERFGTQKGKGKKAMEDAVGDIVEADPNFVARLQSQLKRIARG